MKILQTHKNLDKYCSPTRANDNENIANPKNLKILLSKVMLANENENIASSQELEKYDSAK